MQSLLRVQAALPLPLSFTNKYPPYPPLIHGHQRKHFCNRLVLERRHKRDFGVSSGCFALLYPGVNFFSCGTARKTQVKLELAKKANIDFHSLDCSIVHRVIWVLMEENILSLTDVTHRWHGRDCPKNEIMNSYWTLIFNCISTTSRKQWLPSHSGIFLSFQAIWQDNAGIQLVLVTVLVPAMMPSVLRLCRQLLYISVLKSLSLSLSSVLYRTQKSDFQTEGKFITYFSPESIKKPEAIMNSKERIF